jgi:plasmid stability protein
VPDVLIRDLPEATLDLLKRRAAQHRRSLQQELHSILQVAAAQPGERTAAEVAEAIRTRLAGSGRTFIDSVSLLREDRER